MARPLEFNPTGQHFGRLFVIGKMAGARPLKWLCLCDCGTTKGIAGRSLKTGNTKSCGCLRNETTGRRSAARIKHGMYGTAEYKAWLSMLYRCNNPRCHAFANYGGRGITVCEAWESFEQFYADMGDRPPRMSLDRINNNGNYEPSNCRWATALQQAQNTRKSRKENSIG